MLSTKLKTAMAVFCLTLILAPGIVRNQAHATPQTQDFTLTLSQSGLVKLKRGTGFILDRTITSINGFNGTVDFQIGGLPLGVTSVSVLDDGPVTGSGTSGIGIQSDKHNFQLNAVSTVTVTATSGSLTHTASFQMEVI